MNEVYDVFEKHGFYLARMISGSKSTYRQKYPKNDVLFNANIFTPTKNKVWYGDLDITLDSDKLQNVCNEIGEEMIIVGEMFGRFGAEERPYTEIEKNAHTKFIPNAKTYLEREYNGFTSVLIDKMHIVTNNPIGWIERKFKKIKKK
jgi:hypothetical protein